MLSRVSRLDKAIDRIKDVNCDFLQIYLFFNILHGDNNRNACIGGDDARDCLDAGIAGQ